MSKFVLFGNPPKPVLCPTQKAKPRMALGPKGFMQPLGKAGLQQQNSQYGSRWKGR